MVESLTSLGNTPGAIVLTRTFVPANVVANIRLRCVAAALLEAYANCPLLLPFIYPDAGNVDDAGRVPRRDVLAFRQKRQKLHTHVED
jgi:hypothetical protein